MSVPDLSTFRFFQEITTTPTLAADAIAKVDTVGELVGAELGSLLGSKGSKVRNPCFLHFFSCYEVI
jgi:hypothetical protein